MNLYSIKIISIIMQINNNNKKGVLGVLNILFNFFSKRIYTLKKEEKKIEFNTMANSIIACSDCEKFMIEYACVDCPYKKS